MAGVTFGGALTATTEPQRRQAVRQSPSPQLPGLPTGWVPTRPSPAGAAAEGSAGDVPLPAAMGLARAGVHRIRGKDGDVALPSQVAPLRKGH